MKNFKFLFLTAEVENPRLKKRSNFGEKNFFHNHENVTTYKYWACTASERDSSGNFSESCDRPKKHPLDDYDFIVLDLDFAANFDYYSKNLDQKSEKEFYKEHFDTKKPIFVLNTHFLKMMGSNSINFIKKFFDLSEKIEISALTVDPDYPEDITDNFKNKMMPFYALNGFEPNNNSEILNKIGNQKDEVVGFRIDNRYFIPFDRLDQICLDYILDQVTRLNSSSFNTFQSMCSLLEKSTYLKTLPLKVQKEFLSLTDLQSKLEKTKQQNNSYFEKFSEFVKNDFPLLVSSPTDLKLVLFNFLKKNNFEMDEELWNTKSLIKFSFLFDQNTTKHVICYSTSYKKNKITEDPFTYLLEQESQFLQNPLSQDNLIQEKDLILLLVVNNGINLHPDDRKLEINSQYEKRYFESDPNYSLLKVITTINLLNILKLKNGKKIFLDKLLKRDKLQINI